MRFLEGLERQSYRHFRLIVVDQNADNRVEQILFEKQFSFPTLYLHSTPGLSRARNMGLKYVAADLVAFPDDDCWYADDLLAGVAEIFEAHPEWDGITGKASSGSGAPSQWKWDAAAGAIDKYNVWQRGISITVFLRRKVVQQVGEFDERIGIGSGTPWGAGEETDYLLRALQLNFYLQYLPSHILVYHPDEIPNYSPQDCEKALQYGAGMGFVLRKHRYPAWFVAREFLRPALNVLRSLVKSSSGRARYFSHVFWGRLTGWADSSHS